MVHKVSQAAICLVFVLWIASIFLPWTVGRASGAQYATMTHNLFTLCKANTLTATTYACYWWRDALLDDGITGAGVDSSNGLLQPKELCARTQGQLYGISNEEAFTRVMCAAICAVLAVLGTIMTLAVRVRRLWPRRCNGTTSKAVAGLCATVPGAVSVSTFFLFENSCNEPLCQAFETNFAEFASVSCGYGVGFYLAGTAVALSTLTHLFLGLRSRPCRILFPRCCAASDYDEGDSADDTATTATRTSTVASSSAHAIADERAPLVMGHPEPVMGIPVVVRSRPRRADISGSVSSPAMVSADTPRPSSPSSARSS